MRHNFIIYLSVRPSVTVMHPPKAVRRSEMPFGRYTRLAQVRSTFYCIKRLKTENIGSLEIFAKISIQYCGQTFADTVADG